MTMQAVAEDCVRGSEDGRYSFPQQLGLLADAGIEGYAVDYRRGVRTFYPVSGAPFDVGDGHGGEVAAGFDATVVAEAVRRSQAGAHSYPQFSVMVMAAGCAGYLVSMPGRRVVYFGRTGETHVELMP